MQPSKLPIDCSFRLTLASAPFQPLLPHCVSRFRDKSSILISLRTLILSCRSFCNSRPSFSIACGLFLQNTGGWGTPQPLCSTAAHQIARPLFSWSYKLLFAEPLYFDNYLRCPSVWGTSLFSQPAKTVLLFSTWRYTSALSFKQFSADAVLPSAHVRPVLPPSTSGTFVCPQTAHVAVDAFPSKLLSICLEAIWRAASSPSGPKPSSSAAMAPGSSRPTSSPPNRNWSSAARRPTKRSRPASSARSAPRATPISMASRFWTAPPTSGTSTSPICQTRKSWPAKLSSNATVASRERWPTTAISPPTSWPSTTASCAIAKSAAPPRYGNKPPRAAPHPAVPKSNPGQPHQFWPSRSPLPAGRQP